MRLQRYRYRVSGHGPEQVMLVGIYLGSEESELRCAQAALQHQTVEGTGRRSPRRRTKVPNWWVEPGSPAWTRRAPVDHLFKNQVDHRRAWSR